jgi:hypothetical protein
MSLQECAEALQANGSLRINAGEFSSADLVAAANEAMESHALLFIYNLKGLTADVISSIANAGGRQIIFDDVRMI